MRKPVVVIAVIGAVLAHLVLAAAVVIGGAGSLLGLGGRAAAAESEAVDLAVAAFADFLDRRREVGNTVKHGSAATTEAVERWRTTFTDDMVLATAAELQGMVGFDGTIHGEETIRDPAHLATWTEDGVVHHRVALCLDSGDLRVETADGEERRFEQPLETIVLTVEVGDDGALVDAIGVETDPALSRCG